MLRCPPSRPRRLFNRLLEEEGRYRSLKYCFCHGLVPGLGQFVTEPCIGYSLPLPQFYLYMSHSLNYITIMLASGHPDGHPYCTLFLACAPALHARARAGMPPPASAFHAPTQGPHRLIVHEDCSRPLPLSTRIPCANPINF
jgi:hypothetical protein